MPRFRSFVALAAAGLAAGAIATGATASAIPTDWGVLTQVLVPLQGSAGATGNVSYQLDWRAHKVCYALNATGVDVTGAMIGKGKAGEAGTQVVEVKPRGRPGAQTWDGCIDTDAELVKDMIANPSNYYFAVKSASNANALRTQLDAKGMDLS